MTKRFIGIMFLLIMLTAVFFVGIRTRYPIRYGPAIQRGADRLSPALISAVIHAESKFKPDALSKKGAMGLMQVTGPTGEWMASVMKLTAFETDMLYDPEINIAVGCYFLNWLTDYYGGDQRLALCAYNAGLGNVNRWLADIRYSPDGSALDVIPFPETDQYIRRVENNRFLYEVLWRIPFYAVNG